MITLQKLVRNALKLTDSNARFWLELQHTVRLSSLTYPNHPSEIPGFACDNYVIEPSNNRYVRKLTSVYNATTLVYHDVTVSYRSSIFRDLWIPCLSRDSYKCHRISGIFA